MKFETVWADIASQNATLKIITVCLSATVFGTTVLATFIGMKDPLVIERGCSSALAQMADSNSLRPTDSEKEQFIREAMAMRFSSRVTPNLNYLTVPLAKARAAEQEDYARKRISQFVIVHKVQLDGETATIEADRIVAVDKLRSAFPVMFMAKLATTQRTAENPYGLVLTSVELKPEGSSK